MSEENTNYWKLKTLAYWLFIGVAGSALWDIFVKDLIYYLGNVFVKTASLIYTGYFDRLYADVGRQPPDFLLYIPGILALTLIISMPFNYILIKKVRNSRNKRSHPYFAEPPTAGGFSSQHPRIFKAFSFILLVGMALIYTDEAIISLSCSKAVRIIQMRLEIIRPYISDHQSQIYLSEFRLINDRQKIQKLIDSINKVAQENNIEMPPIRLYGIHT